MIIATFDGRDSLRRLLGSIAENFRCCDAEYEVIVANNVHNPNILKCIAALADEFRQVEEPLAGKCRAQNGAILETRGGVLAVVDDDVASPSQLAISARVKTRYGAIAGIRCAKICGKSGATEEALFRSKSL
jgi:hypothetical protein